MACWLFGHSAARVVGIVLVADVVIVVTAAAIIEVFSLKTQPS